MLVSSLDKMCKVTVGYYEFTNAEKKRVSLGDLKMGSVTREEVYDLALKHSAEHNGIAFNLYLRTSHDDCEKCCDMNAWRHDIEEETSERWKLQDGDWVDDLFGLL